MKKANSFSLILAVLFAIGAASCATSQPPKSLDELLSDRGYKLGEPVDRIQNYRINGWNYVDSKHLVLLDTSRNNYLVTFRQVCHGLQSNELVAHTSTNSQLTKFDKFMVRDSGSKIVDNCYIDSLHRLVKTG